MRLGRNAAQNLLRWLGEAARARACGVAELIREHGLDSAADEKLSPNDAIAALLAAAKAIRYPALSGIEERFSATAAQLVKGSPWRAHPSQNFESDDVRIEAKIGSRQELARALESLTRMRDSAIWETLWAIARIS